MQDKPLIKLMKNLIKESWKGVVIANAAIFLSCVLLGLLVFIIDANFFRTTGGILLYSSIQFTIYLIIFAAVGILIYNIFKTMNQKLFTSEGYLTFTLPVNTDQLLISRIIVNMMWIICTAIVSFFGIVVFAFLVSSKEIITYGSSLIVAIYDLASELSPIVFLGLLFKEIVNIIFYLVLLLLALAIVNTSSKGKNRSFLAILLYLLGTSISNSLQSFISLIIPFGFSYNADGGLSFTFGYNSGSVLYAVDFSSIFLYIGLSVGAYFLTRYLIKNKLELL